MDVNCVVVELKPGSLGRVKEWAKFILDNRAEALVTLDNEGLHPMRLAYSWKINVRSGV